MKILIIDDEIIWIKVLTSKLKKSMPDAEIIAANSGNNAIHCLNQCEFDYATIDLGMPDGTGIKVVHHVIREKLKVKFCIITAVSCETSPIKFLKSIKANIIDKCDKAIDDKLKTFFAKGNIDVKREFQHRTPERVEAGA